MKKYLIIGAFLTVLIAPNLASAQTVADLQAQIAALLTQIQQLQNAITILSSTTCTATPPANLNETNITTTSVKLNWTPGTGGIKQALRVGTDPNAVNSGCPSGTGPGTGCLIKEDNLPLTQNSYNITSGLTASTTYYWRVVTFNSASCYKDAKKSFTTQSVSIKGTFISFPWNQHNNYDIEAWKKEFVYMKDIGFDTVIISGAIDKGDYGTGLQTIAYYNSNAYAQNEYKYLHVDMIFALADEMGFKVYVGPANIQKWWDDKEELISMSKTAAQEIYNRHGNRPSFAGWYVSAEPFLNAYDYNGPWKELTAYYKSLSPNKKVMTAPYFIPFCYPGRFRCNNQWWPNRTPQEMAEQAKKFMLEAGIDIIAVQDGVGASKVTFDELAAYLPPMDQQVKSIGKEFWTDMEICELYQGRYIPASIERIKEQIRIENDYNIVIWIFRQFMSPTNNNQTLKLYNDYKNYFSCTAAPPTNLTETNLTTTSVKLNWTPGTGGTKQALRVGTDSNAVNSGCPNGTGPNTGCLVKEDNLPLTQNSYPITSGLTASTTYYWRVVTFNSASCYKDAKKSFTTPLSIPTNLQVSPVSSSQINLSWNASTDDVGVKGYKVYRCRGSGCVPVNQIATTTAISYKNIGLVASTIYAYQVAAYDAAGNVSNKSASVSAATLPAPTIAPVPPSNLTATSTSCTSIKLSWKDNSINETGFKIERKIGATGTYAQITATAANIISYTNTGLTANTTYYYQVRAYNSAGNSNYSNEANIATGVCNASVAPLLNQMASALESAKNLLYQLLQALKNL